MTHTVGWWPWHSAAHTTRQAKNPPGNGLEGGTEESLARPLGTHLGTVWQVPRHPPSCGMCPQQLPPHRVTHSYRESHLHTPSTSQNQPLRVMHVAGQCLSPRTQTHNHTTTREVTCSHHSIAHTQCTEPHPSHKESHTHTHRGCYTPTTYTVTHRSHGLSHKRTIHTIMHTVTQMHTVHGTSGAES